MFNDIIKNLSQLLKFDSAQAEPEAGAPFGKGARKSLDYFLNLAAFLGFKTKNYDGYAGEVEFGKGKDFAILAHLDVVPAGSGWTHDPFGGESIQRTGASGAGARWTTKAPLYVPFTR